MADDGTTYTGLLNANPTATKSAGRTRRRKSRKPKTRRRRTGKRVQKK
jgi:hypothetical protein